MMKRFLLIQFAICACFLTNAHAQTVGSGTNLNILNNDDFEGFEILDSAISKARVIMTGENHTYVGFNNKMELKTLRYLNKKLGLRDFVIELGGARAHFLNRYINESDTMAEKYLKATTSPKYMDLFKRLRKYNLTLPDSLRIRVHGIDVERFNDLPLMRLAELLPDSGVPPTLYAAADAVEMASAYLLRTGLEDYETARDQSGWGNYNEPVIHIGRSIVTFLEYYDSLNSDFRNWLGADFEQIDGVVNWLREYKTWREYENTTYQYIWREEGIYRNLSTLVREQPSDRFYGEFGRCHVAYQEQNGDCGWYGYHSVINKMRTRFFKNDSAVLTIGLFYYGSSDNSYYTDKDENEDIQNEVDEMIDNTNRKTVTLFDLRDEDADMPYLSKKFSYAIVNNHFMTEDDDSLESEIIDPSIAAKTEFKSYPYYSYGYTLTNINRDVLGNYIASNGRVASIAPIGFQQLAFGVSGVFSTEFRFGWMRPQTLHEDTAGALKYGITVSNYRLGYQFIRKPGFQVNVGGDMAFSREKITFINENKSFLTPRVYERFLNNSFSAGPSVQLNFSPGEWLYFGIQASYMNDFSKGQWYYKGSNQAYGPKGTVSAGATGLYYGGYIGIRVSLYNNSDYTDYEYEE